jgi:hypothetical protein
MWLKGNEYKTKRFLNRYQLYSNVLNLNQFSGTTWAHFATGSMGKLVRLFINQVMIFFEGLLLPTSLSCGQKPLIFRLEIVRRYE